MHNSGTTALHQEEATTEDTQTNEQLDKQMALEYESRQLGIIRYDKTKPMPWRDSASKRRDEADTSVGKELIRRSIQGYIDGLNETISRTKSGKGGSGRVTLAVKYLKLFEPEEVCFIAARRIVSAASDREGLVSCAMSIATMLQDHFEFQQFAANEPALYRHWQKKLENVAHYGHRRGVMKHAMKTIKVEHLDWAKSDMLHVGVKLVELFIKHTGLCEIKETVNQGRSKQIIQPTAETMKWLDKQHRLCALFSPVLLPMVVPPQDWTNVRDGGYIIHRAWLMTGVGRRFIEDLDSVHMPKVYEALNNIQSVPWCINTAILDVLREAWDRGLTVGGLPSRELLPIPPRPHHISPTAKFRDLPPDQQRELKDWTTRAALAHTENASLVSARLAVSNQLWVAERFKDEPSIYFPHHLDFRGRVYPIPPLLNPQADDVGRALLQFSNGKPLGETGGYWLAVHLANSFGFDKASFDERVAWVQEHTNQILDSALNPLDGEGFWMEADAPWQFLAACVEWAGFTMMGEDYVSRIPIHLDGSCSGLQHFSALLLDPVGGAAVNLVPSDTKADVYQIVADKVEAAIADSTEPRERAWQGKVTRKVVKRPTMTFVYSATERGMRDQIVSTIREMGMKDVGGFKTFDASNAIVKRVVTAIRSTVVAAAEAMDWLQSVAKEKGDANERLLWVTPIGLPVKMDTRRMNSKRVSINMAGRPIQLFIELETGDIHTRRLTFGVAPNFIHGMDASHLMLTAIAWGGDDLAVIHDSFGAHACDVGRLHEVLREQFVELYDGQNWLAQFAEDVGASTAPPSRGKLRVEQVLNSDFCFA